MSKYDLLTTYLRQLREDRWVAQFSEIEKILGIDLPISARKLTGWWANNESLPSRHCKAWMSVGWKTENVDIDAETVIFQRFANLNTIDRLNARTAEELALLSARYALRDLPQLVLIQREDVLLSVILSVFRTIAVSWFVGTWPEDTNEDITCAATEASIDAKTAKSILHSSNEDIKKVRTIEHIVPISADAARIVSNLHLKRVPNIIAAGIMRRDKMFRYSSDLDAFEKGVTGAELSTMPLWPEGRTAGTMVYCWDQLKSRLPENEDWDVWTDWYDARLRGTVVNKGLEKARILIPKEEDWEKGPAHVNAIIKRLIDEHWPTFRQVAARRIAQYPKEIAVNAEKELQKIAQRLEELRANLPNEPEALNRAQQEIARLEALQNSLTTILNKTRSLPEGASEEQAEPAASAVEDLAQQLKIWVSEYLTKKRTEIVADAVLVAGLVGLLTLCGMPPWLASSYMIANFSGIDVIEKIRATLRMANGR